jgi:beta-fructofuranosidase
MQLTPTLAGPWINVYQPQPAVYPGPDSPSFRAGQRYERWVPNDFTVIKGPDGRWHALGITHPEGGVAVHEAEWLAFNAAAPEGPLAAQLVVGVWEQLPHVLPPAERPDERYELYAPYAIERGGLYYLFYGPTEMRLATSPDLYHWQAQGILFGGEEGARDPCVVWLDGRYVLVYIAGRALYVRESDDLRQWGERREIYALDRPGSPESPYLVQRPEGLYLFYCIWDGTNGDYDDRTTVLYAETLDFHGAPEVAQLRAHAPEVICDERGDWYVASVERPYRGVSIAPLVWR